ncbi:MAG: hypothetical protein BGO52_21290 [Sphingobacteriales bacterium 44-61]|nr:MAG: hypothetical protein BGO52_21290 [Sphingobacteriales bacterium 44-61]
MKGVSRFFLGLLLFVLEACMPVQKGFSQQPFDPTIFVPSKIDKNVKESVDDMVYWIQKATGVKFRIEEKDSPPVKGIRIMQANPVNLSSGDWKKINSDGQSFYLSVQQNNVTIAGTGANSIINGIYTFLHEAGFRWYMPGDNWTKLGDFKNLPRINKVYTPDFRDRFYFGSGGTTIIPGLDPNDSFRNDFKTWDRRNRISSDYITKGHSGLPFYKANKAVLDQHPEYFCNNKVNPNGIIDISNKDVVDLYVKWALANSGPDKRFPVVGVDPADGSGNAGDCLPSNMPEIKTWSDKYFWLANQAAKRINSKDTVTLVQLYAYSNHAAPPSMALHRSIYPILIPYAFQQVASPEDFIKMWRQKLGNRAMGIYDYWNITQWSKCLPQFNIYNIPIRLTYWKKNNVATVNLESTYANGPMGHAMWLASQMMWDTSLPFDKLYNEFLTNCFGAAASDIRRMYDRWSKNFQYEMEVDFSLRDLAAASAKINDPAIQERIEELKAYVHYIKLYFEYDNKKDITSYNALINYLYSIHHLRLVHTYALEKLYIPKPAMTSAQPGQDKSKNIVIASDNDIETNFRKDLSSVNKGYTISAFQFDISKAVRVNDQNPPYAPKYINGKNNYNFELTQSRDFLFSAGSTKNTTITITDKTGKQWLNKEIKASDTSTEPVKLYLPAGQYTLTAGEARQFTRLAFPADIIFISSDKNYDNYQYPVQYVYVPADVNEIVYRDVHAAQQKGLAYWVDPGKKKIRPELVTGTVYRVTVPDQYKGKVWGFFVGHSGYQLLNIPSFFSVNNFMIKQ